MTDDLHRQLQEQLSRMREQEEGPREEQEQPEVPESALEAMDEVDSTLDLKPEEEPVPQEPLDVLEQAVREADEVFSEVEESLEKPDPQRLETPRPKRAPGPMPFEPADDLESAMQQLEEVERSLPRSDLDRPQGQGVQSIDVKHTIELIVSPHEDLAAVIAEKVVPEIQRMFADLQAQAQDALGYAVSLSERGSGIT